MFSLLALTIIASNLPRNEQPRGDWTCTNNGYPAQPYTPGAVQQTWTNNNTGETATYWANIGGNGPQVRTLNNLGKK